MMISVIIPVFNEAKVIQKCISSLSQQTNPHEIIVVDDGSSDRSGERIAKIKEQLGIKQFKLVMQTHRGPAAARNAGAKIAEGDILVFIDADMTFAPDFLETLVKPISLGQSRGTFTKDERVANWENVWARSWNYNEGIATPRRIPENYPDSAPVFRALLKKEFLRVGGFTEGIGWTDDWSLSRKLGVKSTATAAVCYHANPSSLADVYTQARWIGKNEFLTRNSVRLLLNLVRYSIPVTLVTAFYGAVRYRTWQFIFFKTVYNFGILISLLLSFVEQDKNK
ncbi:TPA: hypothetical protein DIV55_02545 [Patescibacteria group bacterium]|uniref:Glycosyltransferase 2-like domain-containing protein n=1 Tax=Candidatus Gottesmanbacteria bacterium GW2011_GWA1_43_11 TaxID=1618436 RepID=A0A0G1CLB7_9BACT|nr:MAG: hypothetical protein UV59_C0001G0012 [Candidatus Gottesmanbacteria bacterium GW2011_GWA1_43_11]HCS78599.1 hypothetical protein [Patescibacteria group bacterium]